MRQTVDMEYYFGPEGVLSRGIERFEYRAPQLEMARAVARCIEEQVPLMAEAGTGTGKTWAYLIPAIASGRKVIISTGTKTLQDQVLDHDIPLLRRLIHPGLKAVCLKGRRNYLCRRRFRELAYQPTLWNKEEAGLFRKFQSWAARTPSGDRAEIDWLPDHFHTWSEVCSSADHCLGQQCEDISRCFLARARQEAAQSHLVVVNHHLFFADLAVRERGLGEVIPEYDAAVFDEAHQLEDIIALYFGVQFSSIMMRELTGDLLQECGKIQAKGKSAVKWNGLQQVQAIGEQMDALVRALYHVMARQKKGQGRFGLSLEQADPELVQTGRRIIHGLEQLSELLPQGSDDKPMLESCRRRGMEMAQALEKILDQTDESLVYWYELTPPAIFLNGTPIQIAPICQERLFRRSSALVFTSATLSVASSFDYSRQSLGIPAESRELVLPSPFAFHEQAILYVPDGKFPAPHESDFCRMVADQALEILTRTRGRALFLFTSYRNMHDVHQRLRDRLPYPILVQGERPKRVLLHEFKEKVDSVLLATSSFWQGIDVPGEALSCLLIDKLPFEVPDDPIPSARMELLSRAGKNAFFSYQVPRAIIQLKQGVGRLIRSSRDRGLIVIFDARLFTKSYGRLFIKSLPPCGIVHRIEDLDPFLLSLAPSVGRLDI